MQLNFCDITVAIVAHNAADTIARAVRSAVANSSAPVLLIDDFSTDGTAALAQKAGSDRLRVVRPTTHKGVGNARKTALDHLETRFGIWLDADDEFLPGRTARHLQKLTETPCDIVFDGGLLIDGTTDTVLHGLSIPDFILSDGKTGRQLERNWLPVTQCSFDCAFARNIGYDPSFKAAEDYDFMLRALLARARHGFIAEPGYKYYHYPTSLSRALETATDFSLTARMKHPKADIDQYLAHDDHLNAAEKLWTASLHTLAANACTQAHTLLAELSECDDPIAPYPARARDLAYFMAGTLHLRLGDPAKGLESLRQVCVSWPGAEVWNNMGAAHWLLADVTAARKAWQSALAALPGYGDANANLQMTAASQAPRITQLPMRPSPTRPYYKIETL